MRAGISAEAVFNEAAYKRPPAAVPLREHEESWLTAILITFPGTNDLSNPMGNGVSRWPAAEQRPSPTQ